MRNNHEKRLQAAENKQAAAASVFTKLAEDFEAASRDHRGVFDDLETEIARLTELKDRAQTAGLRATEQAKKVRDLFL